MKFFIVLIFFAQNIFAHEVKIRDLVVIKGVRSNTLNGVGLVIGLNKSGDTSKFLLTNKSAASFLQKSGVKAEEKDFAGGTMALVALTAELPPFAKAGNKLDIRLSTLGDARSLAGGTLILSQLKAGDGEIYVSAQGSISIGQANGDKLQVQTVAIASNAGTIEREFNPTIDFSGSVTLLLKEADFTNNKRISDSINEHFRGFYAYSFDYSSIAVSIPPRYVGKTVEFLSDLENLAIDFQQKSVVVINERTGTVVMGGDVMISPITISHGDLAVTIGEKKKDAAGKRVVNFGGNTVNKLVEAMNQLGMKPADLISVLQAIHQAGAIQGELKIL